MRRVALGGVAGGLPGVLIVFVPLLLHGAGLITSDQSQVGFIGIPVAFTGAFIGGLGGAAGTPLAGRVALGLILGLGGGIAGGVGLTLVLRSAGVSVPGLWLFLALPAMIAGGVIAAWSGPRAGTAPPREPAEVV